MEMMEMTVEFAGAPIHVKVYPDQNYLGALYEIEMEGNYAFTVYFNEDDEWSIMREADGTTPEVDAELLKKILKNLQYQLRYAA